MKIITILLTLSISTPFIYAMEETTTTPVSPIANENPNSSDKTPLQKLVNELQEDMLMSGNTKSLKPLVCINKKALKQVPQQSLFIDDQNEDEPDITYAQWLEYQSVMAYRKYLYQH
jgi:hypothetical protein